MRAGGLWCYGRLVIATVKTMFGTCIVAGNLMLRYCFVM